MLLVATAAEATAGHPLSVLLLKLLAVAVVQRCNRQRLTRTDARAGRAAGHLEILQERQARQLAALQLLVKDLLGVMLYGTAVPLQMVLLAVGGLEVLAVILLESQAHLVLVVLV